MTPASIVLDGFPKRRNTNSIQCLKNPMGPAVSQGYPRHLRHLPQLQAQFRCKGGPGAIP